MPFLPFDKARDFARKLGIKSQRGWNEWRENRPTNIPSSPDQVYHDTGWKSWPDWLGYEKREKPGPNREYLSFKDARDIISRLGLKTQKQWREWSKKNRPENIPSEPERTYKNKGWISLHNWLGCEKKKIFYLQIRKKHL